jgi:hypothetical protein
MLQYGHRKMQFRDWKVRLRLRPAQLCTYSFGLRPASSNNHSMISRKRWRVASFAMMLAEKLG